MQVDKRTKGCLFAFAGLSVLMLLAVTALAGAGVWWMKNNAGRLKDEALGTRDTANAFGQGKQAQDCVDEGLRQAVDCMGGIDVPCNVRTTLFLRYCLETASLPPGYCDEVPDSSSPFASMRYRITACAGHGLTNNTSCQALFAGVQQYCDSQR